MEFFRIIALDSAADSSSSYEFSEGLNKFFRSQIQSYF